MASRELLFKITGDAKDLQRSLKVADTSLDKTGKQATDTGKKMSSAFKVAGVAAAGALAVGLQKSAKAAIDAEASQAKVRKTVENAGISWTKHAKQIDEVIQKHAQLTGFDDEELAESFANMVRTTGDLNEAFKLNALAADIARQKGMNLAGAQSLIARVYNGSFTGVKRLGVAVREGATATEVLGDLQRKFGGQAEAYGKTTAGAADKASVAWENFQEVLGEKMLPVLAKVAQALADVINWLSRGGPAVTALTAALGALAAAFVAVKIASFVTAVVGMIGAVTAATVAMGGLNGAFIASAILIQRHPFVIAITALVALGAALVLAYKKSETFRNIVNGAFEAVKKVAIPVANAVKDATVASFNAIADAVRFLARVFQANVTVYKAAAEAIGRAVVGGFDFMKSIPSRVGGFLRDGVTSLRGFIERFFEGGFELGKMVVNGIVAGVGAIGKNIAKAIADAISDAWDFVKDAIGDLAGNVANSVGDIGPTGGGTFSLGTPGGAMKGLTWRDSQSGSQPVTLSVARSLGSRYGPLTVTSAHRTAAENAAAGGAAGSLHLSGLALDLVPSEGWTAGGTARLDRIANWAKTSKLVSWIGWRGVPDHGPGNHLHLSLAPQATPGGSGVGDVTARTAATGRYLNINQIQRAARQGGVPNIPIAAAVAMAESSGDRQAVGDNGNSKGLWQIHLPSHPWARALNLFDPVTNARAAKRVHAGQGWSAWTQYRNGEYKKFLKADSTKSSSAGTGGTSGSSKAKGTLVGKTKPQAGVQQGSTEALEGELAVIENDEANAGGETAASIDNKAAAIYRRIGKIDRDFASGKVKRPATRTRLLRERAQLVTQIRSMAETRAGLLAPATTDATVDTGPTEDPNQPLIDAINAQAEVQRKLLDQTADLNATQAAALKFAQAVSTVSGSVVEDTLMQIVRQKLGRSVAIGTLVAGDAGSF